MNFEIRKVYYYIICLITAFVFLWGAIDLFSASITSLSIQLTPSYITDKDEEAGLDKYYQKRLAEDKILDAIARISVAGIAFMYCRRKASDPILPQEEDELEDV